MDRNLAMEFVRVTEAAALAASRIMGRGDEAAADQVAVDAMRTAFDGLSIQGRVVIGEGERDEAPMLYIGEEVGRRGEDCPKVDIALDPLEGTTITARGGVGALSVIAAAEKGNFLHAPDTYMDKIAVGPKARGKVDINSSPTENLRAVAAATNKKVEDLTVAILDRPRHEKLIQEVRDAGARIHMVLDGDIATAIATSWGNMGIDMLLGIGGAPEGVISAAAMKCLGGDFQGKLCFRNDDEKRRAESMGVSDLEKSYSLEELAAGDVMFCATGVTHGPLVKGILYQSGDRAFTQSIVMRSKSGTIRLIDAWHDLKKKKL